MEKKPGTELIAQERREQVEKHGRSLKRDIAENTADQLSDGASMLALNFPKGCLEIEDVVEHHCPEGWDNGIWEKMANKPYAKRLVIAGALIAAELDRINGEDITNIKP